MACRFCVYAYKLFRLILKNFGVFKLFTNICPINVFIQIRHVSVTVNYYDFLLKFRQALTVLVVRVHRKWGNFGFAGQTPGVHFDLFFFKLMFIQYQAYVCYLKILINLEHLSK